MRWRSGMAIMLLITLLMAPALSYISQASTVHLSYALVNNTLTVETLHYRLVLDVNKGGVTELNLTNDLGDQYVLLSNASIPLLSIIVDDKIIRNGTIDIIGEEKDMQLIVEVTYITDYGNIIEKITFYSWSPKIKIELKSDNIIENLTIVMIAGVAPSENETVKRVYTYAENGNITSKVIISDGVHEVDQGEIPISVATIGLLQAGNETGPANMSFFQGISFAGGNLPSKLSTRTEANGNATTSYIEELTFTNFTSTVLAFMATNYAPAVLAVPPFATPLSAVADIGNNLDMIANLNKYVKDLKNRIDLLNNTLSKLKDRLDELQKELDMYKGCEDHYKQEIAARDYQIQRLEERLKTTGMIEAAVFIIGILLGVVAGRYILSK